MFLKIFVLLITLQIFYHFNLIVQAGFCGTREKTCDQSKPCCLDYTCNEQKKCQLTSEICKKQFIKCEEAAECCDELVCTNKICQPTQNTCGKINEKCFGMEYPCCENLACNQNGYRCEDPHRN